MARSAKVRIRIGDTVVVSDRPTAAAVKRSVAQSTEALRKLGQVLAKPGVRLYTRRGVPLYSADPENPDLVIRKLDGRIDRGVLENGAFKVID